MLTIRIGDYKQDDHPGKVVQIWRGEGDDHALIVLIPVDEGEVVRCTADNLMCQAGEDGEAVVVLQ